MRVQEDSSMSDIGWETRKCPYCHFSRTPGDSHELCLEYEIEKLRARVTKLEEMLRKIAEDEVD